jgi:hypothetical protein
MIPLPFIIDNAINAFYREAYINPEEAGPILSKIVAS